METKASFEIEVRDEPMMVVAEEFAMRWSSLYTDSGVAFYRFGTEKEHNDKTFLESLSNHIGAMVQTIKENRHRIYSAADLRGMRAFQSHIDGLINNLS